MAAQKPDTAIYRVIADGGGRRYRFFCQLSGAAVCTTGPVFAPTPEKELSLAWESEGKRCFNRCHRCGRWVCDLMFNADVLECVDCAPWEESPRFCQKCGREAPPGEVYCRGCGARLTYMEARK